MPKTVSRPASAENCLICFYTEVFSAYILLEKLPLNVIADFVFILKNSSYVTTSNGLILKAHFYRTITGKFKLLEKSNDITTVITL